MTVAVGTATVRLATRGSALARAQAAIAAAALEARGGVRIETVVVRTLGDKKPTTPVEELPGQGWFTAELERALLDGRADIATHSAKDLATELAPGLRIAGVLPRDDPRDAAITASGAPLASLHAGARVGTSSTRRAALLSALHPHVSVVPMRGNVDTRLRKLDSGEVDALVLACAGLDRLGLGERISERLDPSVFVPSPAQGAIALETTNGSAERERAEAVSHAATMAAITAERTVLRALGGGCLLPLGAWAREADGRLVVSAALGNDGVIRRAQLDGDVADPIALGERIAAALR